MKNLLSLLLLMFVAQVVFAQSDYSYNYSNRSRHSVRFGFKLDPSITWMSPKDQPVEKDGSRLGFSYGFMMDIMLNDNDALATGLEINNQGGKLKYPSGLGVLDNGSGSGNNNYDLRVQYLEIPFALKLATAPVNNIIYWGQFGTYLDFKVGARMDGTVDGRKYDRQNVASSINPFNIGLLLGGGIEYPFGEKTIGMLGLTFHNGFTDVTRNSKWKEDGKIVLNTLSLRLGLFF